MAHWSRTRYKIRYWQILKVPHGEVFPRCDGHNQQYYGAPAYRCKVTHTTSKFMAIRSQLVTSSNAQFMSTSIWTSLALVSPGSLGSQC